FFGWGIASRLPAHLVQEVQPWRGGRGRVEVGDRMVNLAAAHITDPLFGNWRALSRERRIQVDALFEWADGLPDGVPVLIAGDMNASPMWKVYRRLAGRFDDLVAEAAAATGHRPGRTWGPGPNLLRIDHVFGRGL